jgi:hypothetical protein
MGEFIGNLVEFLWAVINNWAGYATGGLIVALVWLWSTLKQKPVPRKIGVILAIVFLFVAFFNAWLDQKKKAYQAELELKTKYTPQLKGEIVYWASGKIERLNNRTAAMVWCSISNIGMQSIANDWHLYLDFPDGKHTEGQGSFVTKKTTFPTPKGDRIVYQEDALYNKALTPIPTGGQINGVLLFEFPDLSVQDLLIQNVKVTLTFKDVSGKSYECFFVLTGKGVDWRYIPGTRSPT